MTVGFLTFQNESISVGGTFSGCHEAQFTDLSSDVEAKTFLLCWTDVAALHVCSVARVQHARRADGQTGR